MKRIIYLLVVLVGISACEEDFFEPKYNNDIDFLQAISDPDIVEGFLLKGYDALPKGQDNYGGFLDCATQNAVHNTASNKLNTTVSENWASNNNPIDNWKKTYEAIQSVNRFITYGIRPVVERTPDTLVFHKGDDEVNKKLRKRLEGEAHFLRGYYYFDLLKRFAGRNDAGELLGVPLVTELLDAGSLTALERTSFTVVLDTIIQDLKRAATLLPEKYEGADPYFGSGKNLGRATSVAANALLSRVYLYAGSPLYELTNATEMNEKAAAAAAAVIDVIGSDLPSVYVYAGANAGYDAYFNEGGSSELLMHRLGGESNGIEGSDFPPSYGGKGRTNPSQNLVDAFPMANGYPIGHGSSTYDAANPYAGRDPRLNMTILYDNAPLKGVGVQTRSGGKDFPGGTGGKATDANSSRTGYYLRKWLSDFVNLESSPATKKFHYFTIVRKGEVFLNYAEAMNEAYGPEADPKGHGMTAVEAIGKVRDRAGITKTGSFDDYLESIKSDKDIVRGLIRNERRLELCFEGHYFYDLRRWKEDLNVPVKGIVISNAGTEFTVKEIHTPNFADHMYFGPMPFDEVTKSPSIEQNAGW